MVHFMITETDSPNPIYVTQFIDVIQRAEYRAEQLELERWLEDDIHPDVAYTEFLTAAVIDIAIIPVEREAFDMSLTEPDDETSLMDTLRRIVSMAALKFNRTLSQTEHDLIKIMKEFPTADVRESATLRHKGLLH